MDRAATAARIAQVIEPFNKKAVTIDDSTSFAGDLEWDSLTVMDFVAAIEDEFDIIITMNQINSLTQSPRRRLYAATADLLDPVDVQAWGAITVETTVPQ